MVMIPELRVELLIMWLLLLSLLLSVTNADLSKNTCISAFLCAFHFGDTSVIHQYYPVYHVIPFSIILLLV